MKIISGIPMIGADDIMSLAGNKIPLCTHLKNLHSTGVDILNEIDNENKITIDTGKGSQQRFNMVGSFKFIFVPLSVMEEKIFTHSMQKTLTFLKTIITDFVRLNTIDDLIDRYDESYDRLSSRYIERSGSVVHSPCIMYLYDEDKLVDVALANVEKILDEVYYKNTTYKCSVCGKEEIVDNRSLDSFLPDMRYEVKGNTAVNYYCSACVKSHGALQHLKHVGE